MIIRRKINLCLIFVVGLGSGCVFVDNGAHKESSSAGLIATPVSYYSTAKARNLATRYRENLDRLAERIVRNPKTSQLQFANNISSVGGIGFFTHSATATPDERYLEIVVATPETFETEREYNEKVYELFSRYGPELLRIIAGDHEIFQDKELRGYGLNFTWRNLVAEAPTNRVRMARAIIYFHKEKVASFLRQGLNQGELLGDARIFAMEDNGPLELVSYQPKAIKPDIRPAIREANLAPGAAEAKPAAPRLSGAKPAESARKPDPAAKTVKEQAAVVPEIERVAGTERAVAAAIPEKKDPPAAKKELPTVSPPAEALSAIAKESSPKPDIAAAKPEHQQKPTVLTKPSSVAAKSAPVASAMQPSPSPANESAPTSGANSLPIKNEIADSSAVVPPPTAGVKTSENITKEKTAETHSEQTGPTVTRQPKANPDPSEPKKEAAKPLSTTAPPERSDQTARVEPMSGIKPPERITIPPVITKAPPSSLVADKKHAAPSSPAGNRQDQQPARETPAPTMPASRQTTAATEPGETVALPRPELKAKEAAPLAVTAPAAPPQAEFVKPEESNPIVTAAKTNNPVPPPLPAPAALPAAAKPEEPAAKASSPTGVSEPVKSSASAASGRDVPSVAPPAPPLREVRPERDLTAPTSSAAQKSESPAVVLPAPSATVVQDKPAAKPATEQLALLRKPEPTIVDKKPLARPVPKALEGYVIQIAFSDKYQARSWAEKMEQRGYAVSVTEAGAAGALRVRLGNFPVRDDAERQLRNLQQEGMNGIVINLPQAFQPEARSSVP